MTLANFSHQGNIFFIIFWGVCQLEVTGLGVVRAEQLRMCIKPGQTFSIYKLSTLSTTWAFSRHKQCTYRSYFTILYAADCRQRCLGKYVASSILSMHTSLHAMHSMSSQLCLQVCWAPVCRCPTKITSQCVALLLLHMEGCLAWERGRVMAL